jgi:general secretion pathway protein I
MRPLPDTAAKDAGFTLLEVMVAFVIAAIALAALYQGASASLTAVGTASLTEEATELAKSHLAAIGRGDAIAPQESSGVDGEQFSWHLSIRPVGSRDLAIDDSDRASGEKPSKGILFDVVVTESWKDGVRDRQVKIATRRFDVQANQ